MACMVIMAMMLSACSSTAQEQKESEPKQQEKSEHEIQAVTSFYPIYVLALNVTDGVENVKLTNMTGPQTGCLHDYQLTTADMKTLSQTDVFIINGAGMESFLDKALESNPKMEILDTSEGVQLVEVQAAHEHESDSDKEEDKDLDGHDDEEYNSHIWLSIPNAIRQTENIRDAFCRLDPEHEEQYKKNTEEFTNSMKQLTDQLKDVDLAEKQEAGIFHEGFDYFANDFGFDVAFGIYADEDAMPSAKEIKEAAEEAKEHNVQMLFAANDSGKEFADTIAQETGAKVYILDPITSGENNKDAYKKAMQENIRVLKEALGK